MGHFIALSRSGPDMTMKIYDLSEEKFSFMDMASHFVGRARAQRCGGTLPSRDHLVNKVGVRQIRFQTRFTMAHTPQIVDVIEFRPIALARKSIEQEVTSESGFGQKSHKGANE